MSKFAGIMQARPKRETSEEEPQISDFQTAESPEVRKSESLKRQKSETPKISTKQQKPTPVGTVLPEVGTGLPETVPPKTPVRLGRPPGKKSDPTYRQVTVYLPVELHEQGKLIAFQSRGEQDFSEIVEKALRGYLDELSDFRQSESLKVQG